jgi:hypothetical protein
MKTKGKELLLVEKEHKISKLITIANYLIEGLIITKFSYRYCRGNGMSRQEKIS